MTKWSCLALPILAAMPLAFAGCAEEVRGVPHVHQEEFEVTLCGQCGDVKADGHTCKAGVAICETCGFHKGSILCCSTAINGHRDVVLCRKCGEVGFTEKCCKEGMAICPSI
jgi:hypothetical protein